MVVRIDLFLLAVYVYPLDYFVYIHLAIKNTSFLWPVCNKSIFVPFICLIMSGSITVIYLSKIWSVMHLIRASGSGYSFSMSVTSLWLLYVWLCNCIDCMASWSKQHCLQYPLWLGWLMLICFAEIWLISRLMLICCERKTLYHGW